MSLWVGSWAERTGLETEPSSLFYLTGVFEGMWQEYRGDIFPEPQRSSRDMHVFIGPGPVIFGVQNEGCRLACVNFTPCEWSPSTEALPHFCLNAPHSLVGSQACILLQSVKGWWPLGPHCLVSCSGASGVWLFVDNLITEDYGCLPPGCSPSSRWQVTAIS